MKKEDNIFKKMLSKIQIEQLQKFLRVIIICMIFMTLSEALFSIPAIKDFFGAGLIEGKSGWLVYVIIWLVMFAQVTIIPIPALPILTACNQISGLVANGSDILNLFSLNTVFFLILTTSASVMGAICAYWIGRKFGRPAVKWVAGSEEDYDKWSDKFNSKTGRWLWAATVLFPIFPDDLISFVVGSIKMNFSFYVIVNIICKTIGTFTMLLFMRVPGIDVFFGKSQSDIPIALITYLAILLIAIIWRAILNKKLNLNEPKNIKLEVVKETILYKINKHKNVYKELIIDYTVDKKYKTYLATPVVIETLYIPNKNQIKDKVRILIKAKLSNYWEIVYDKAYPLTTEYKTLIEDIKLWNSLKKI